MVEVLNKMSSSRQNLPSVWKWFKIARRRFILIGPLFSPIRFLEYLDSQTELRSRFPKGKEESILKLQFKNVKFLCLANGWWPLGVAIITHLATL